MPLAIKPQNAKKALTVKDAVEKCNVPMLEPKYDGWRIIAQIDAAGDVTIWSRTGKPYHQLTPAPILDQLRQFPPNTILDGEIVDGTNNKNCTAVINVLGKSKNKPSQAEMDKLQFIAFDCLEIDGHDLRKDSLRSRRETFDTYICVIEGLTRIAMTVQAEATQDMYELFVAAGFEGAMVKDNMAAYAEGKRGWGWFKLKATQEIDVVVMSMGLDGKGQHEGKVGKFVVGQYQLGELCRRAHVNPYDDAMREAMTSAVLVSDLDAALYNPFVGKVATIKHYGKLKDGLRHPTFVRWREDKLPEECGFDNG